MSTTPRRSSLESALKTTTSSTRFRNSGRKKPLSSSSSTSRMASRPSSRRPELGVGLEDALAADVRGHDDDGVGEVGEAAAAVGEAAVVEHLEEQVEDVGVRLLDLVEEEHAVGPACARPR